MRKKLLVIALLITIALIATVLFFTISSRNEDDSIAASIGVINIYAYDSVRVTDSLIVYTTNHERNPYGYELLVEESTGFVIDADDWVELKDGTFILSGHGVAAEMLRKAEIGDIVTVLEKRIEIGRDMKRSTLKKLEVEKERIEDVVNYRRINLFDIDLEQIEKVDLLIDVAFDDIENYCEGDDIDQAILDKKANEIMSLLEKKFYLSIESNAVEGRGMWHRPGFSGVEENDIEGVREFVSKIGALGINTVYVETYLHGMTVYYSDILESKHQIMSSFECDEYGNDYILALISECHKQNIEVHAWVELLNTGSHRWSLPSHIDDSWLVDDSASDSRFLDPANEQVVEYLCNIVEEMVLKYDFDGISYDYIRYSETGRSNLAETTELQCDAVSALVKSLSERIRSLDKDLVISASPYGYIDDALTIYKQDISTWIENGYLDVILPMIYTENIELLTDTVDEYKAYMSSILQYTGISPIYNGSSIMRNMELIDALNGSSNGFSLFASQNYISKSAEHYEAILEAFTSSSCYVKAIPPTADIKLVFEAWRDQLLDRCDRVYSKYLSETDLNTIKTICLEIELSISESDGISKAIENLEELEIFAKALENDALCERICEQKDNFVRILTCASIRLLK